MQVLKFSFHSKIITSMLSSSTTPNKFKKSNEPSTPSPLNSNLNLNRSSTPLKTPISRFKSNELKSSPSTTPKKKRFVRKQPLKHRLVIVFA